MAFGIKISQQGKDVKTCADKDLIISSSKESLKIYKIGTVSGQVNRAPTVGDYTERGWTINHNLGFVPIFMLFVRENSNSYYTDPAGDWVDNISVYGYSTSTELYIFGLNSDAYNDYTVTIKYYIFANKIE